MLVEITKVPNAENSAIHLHPTDNVAIARVPLPAGTELRVDGLPVLTREPSPHVLSPPEPPGFLVTEQPQEQKPKIATSNSLLERLFVLIGACLLACRQTVFSA